MERRFVLKGRRSPSLRRSSSGQFLPRHSGMSSVIVNPSPSPRSITQAMDEFYSEGPSKKSRGKTKSEKRAAARKTKVVKRIKTVMFPARGAKTVRPGIIQIVSKPKKKKNPGTVMRKMNPSFKEVLPALGVGAVGFIAAEGLANIIDGFQKEDLESIVHNPLFQAGAKIAAAVAVAKYGKPLGKHAVPAAIGMGASAGKDIFVYVKAKMDKDKAMSALLLDDDSDMGALLLTDEGMGYEGDQNDIVYDEDLEDYGF